MSFEDNPVYQADEDSYLLIEALEDELKTFKNKNFETKDLEVLDMGSGSGVIGEVTLKKKINTLFVDINPLAVEMLNKKFSKKLNAKIIESDLFQKVPVKKFDIITFNTPYLPEDEEFFDPALHGGKKGYETTIDFLDLVKDYLKPKGVLLFLISSLTHSDVVESKLYDLSLEHEIVKRKKIFFEELLVYRVVFRG